MISAILLLYLGIQIGAPWWYYALLSGFCLCKILKSGIKIGKEVRELSDDD